MIHFTSRKLEVNEDRKIKRIRLYLATWACTMDPSCRPARHFFMFSDAYTVNLGLEARPAGGGEEEGGGGGLGYLG